MTKKLGVGLVSVLIAGTVAAFVLSSAAASSRAACKTLVVTKSAASYQHYSTIQAAVNRARPCDWILVARGVYPEKVVIKTPNLHLRGLDRNRVIVDGRHLRGVNGIEVAKANRVWIENLTVRNFDLNPKTHGDGNEIWWNGGDETGKVGASGWYGNYLTAYDTGILGSYGIFVSNSVHGAFDHVYASGFSDSGLYIGACPDCYGTVTHALVENNQMGYSGTNAGGHLIIQDSVFRHNSIGVGPNSLPNDAPPPQLGTCDSAKNTSPTPSISSTQIARCTIFRRNQIYDNNNLTAPANAFVIQEGWGIGLFAIGTYGDLFVDNTIYGNKNFGILAVENPVPFPPTSTTVYFQLEGNRFEHNTVRDGKYANIGMAGGVFGEKNSVNNCFTGNVYKTSLPSDLTPWSCANATTPNPDHDASTQIISHVVTMQSESMARKQQGHAAPAPQPTMPHPCRGVPANPLCTK